MFGGEKQRATKTQTAGGVLRMAKEKAEEGRLRENSTLCSLSVRDPFSRIYEFFIFKKGFQSFVDVGFV